MVYIGKTKNGNEILGRVIHKPYRIARKNNNTRAFFTAGALALYSCLVQRLYQLP